MKWLKQTKAIHPPLVDIPFKLLLLLLLLPLRMSPFSLQIFALPLNDFLSHTQMPFVSFQERQIFACQMAFAAVSIGCASWHFAIGKLRKFTTTTGTSEYTRLSLSICSRL
jgi:uncharacterized membrane protein